MSTTDLIKQEVQNILEEVISIRQHLHKHPELSFKEYKTSQFIQDKLNAWGIPFKTGFVDTGIVVELKSGDSDKKLALRADMDALPIQEESNKPYCSQNDNIMHACGHDAHTASLLGSLYILNKHKDLWEGQLTAIFQPGEELLPGGAKLMLEAGALNSNPDYIIGQHVYPDLESGKVGFRGGQYMASCDEIHLTIKGTGGHAALPHKLTDVVLIASQLIVSLQQVVSRKLTPYTPAVLSFGYVNANGATNIIPNEVHLKGTLRCMDEHWREVAHQEIDKLTKYTVEGMGGEYHLDIRKGYPSLFNNPEFTAKAKSIAIDYLGEENVVDLDLRMTAEDFAYYSQVIPSCFYRFGTAEPNKISEKKLHHPEFDIDERRSLETSVGVMTALTMDYLTR